MTTWLLAQVAGRRLLARPGVSIFLVVGVAAVGGLLAWQRRWITDDGLIYTRAVRQILAGNGPVFNAHERVETSTGTLWQWMLALGSGLTSVRPDLVALYLGWALFVAALLMGGFACLRLRGDRPGVLVPFGMLVVVALPPFWDFATSGLETGLTYAWVAGTWFLMVRALARRDGRRQVLVAFVIGLGPLVRPDLALVSLVFFVAIPGLRPWGDKARTARLLVVALAVPVLYQVFRMGYYGQVVPMPAVTKDAAGSDWGMGWSYLLDLISPYQLGAPLAVVVVALVMVSPERLRASRDLWAVTLAPVVASVLCATYVIRVGGDFMHGRMLLPALLLLLLPVFVLPLTRATMAPVAVVGVWAVICGSALRVPYAGSVDARGIIADERGYYATLTGQAHPTAPDYVMWFRGPDPGPPLLSQRGVLFGYGTAPQPPVALDPARSEGKAVVFGYLGSLGAGIDLDDVGVDPLGLADALSAYSDASVGDRPGHAKYLGVEWILADYAAPGAVLPPDVDPARVAAARRALTCGDLRDLIAAEREPMTWGRFVDNLLSAPHRSQLRIPADPYDAERSFCG